MYDHPLHETSITGRLTLLDDPPDDDNKNKRFNCLGISGTLTTRVPDDYLFSRRNIIILILMVMMIIVSITILNIIRSDHEPVDPEINQKREKEQQQR